MPILRVPAMTSSALASCARTRRLECSPCRFLETGSSNHRLRNLVPAPQAKEDCRGAGLRGQPSGRSGDRPSGDVGVIEPRNAPPRQDGTPCGLCRSEPACPGSDKRWAAIFPGVEPRRLRRARLPLGDRAGARVPPGQPAVALSAADLADDTASRTLLFWRRWKLAHA